MKNKVGIIAAGGMIGLIAALLVKFGNPQNMGFCIACFIRDIAGGLGLHRAEVVSYIRPEIIGLVIGAYGMALFKREFSAKAGSSVATRFLLGVAVMIGALVFLGCPLRMVLRIGGGDLNAVVGLVGFVAGIGVGILFLNRGFSLQRNYKTTQLDGHMLPLINGGLLVLLVLAPSFIFFSQKGPGAMKAPLLLSLGAGLLVGIVAQRTRLCMVGGTRDMVLFRDAHLLLGFLSILAFSLIGNLIFKNPVHFSFVNQPVAHTDGLWNFIGMLLVGWGSVLLGGCPLRQLILSGEGNTDSVMSVFGMLTGAAVCHNFGLAASPKGVPVNGQVAVVISLLFVLVVSFVNSKQFKRS